MGIKVEAQLQAQRLGVLWGRVVKKALLGVAPNLKPARHAPGLWTASVALGVGLASSRAQRERPPLQALGGAHEGRCATKREVAQGMALIGASPE